MKTKSIREIVKEKFKIETELREKLIQSLEQREKNTLLPKCKHKDCDKLAKCKDCGCCIFHHDEQREKEKVEELKKIVHNLFEEIEWKNKDSGIIRPEHFDFLNEDIDKIFTDEEDLKDEK